MIRIATLDDVSTILRMSMDFMKTTNMSEYASEEKVQALIEHLITSSNFESIILMYDNDGFIAANKTPFPFGDHWVASEVGWWVEPDKRKSGIGEQLIEGFEYWAKQIGCSLVSLVTLDDQLGKFYEKKGYKLSDRSYVKGI